MSELASGSSTPRAPLNESSRARFAALADLLIPSSDTMWSASEAGVADAGVDGVLAVRLDLVEPLRIALDWPAGRRAGEVLHSLKVEQPAVFAALGEIVAGAYYQVPGVQDRIGYHGRAAVPVTDLSDEDRELLQMVVHRGRIYRDDPRDLP